MDQLDQPTQSKEQIRANLRNKIRENQMRRTGQIYRKQQGDLKETKERKAGTDKKMGKTLTKFLQKDGLHHVLKQFGIDDVATENNIIEEIQRGDIKTYTDITKIITKHVYKKQGKSIANAPLDINSEQFANMFRELKEMDAPQQSSPLESEPLKSEPLESEPQAVTPSESNMGERKTMKRSTIKDVA